MLLINSPLFQQLAMVLRKADEMESLIKGIELIASNEPDECYYYENPLDSDKCHKVTW